MFHYTSALQASSENMWNHASHGQYTTGLFQKSQMRKTITLLLRFYPAEPDNGISEIRHIESGQTLLNAVRLHKKLHIRSCQNKYLPYVPPVEPDDSRQPNGYLVLYDIPDPHDLKTIFRHPKTIARWILFKLSQIWKPLSPHSYNIDLDTPKRG